MIKRKLFIGTSGWVYGHWDGIFYPENLPSKDKLKYFSKHFKTAEVNYSFYHLPRPNTYQKWYQETPADFIFAVKASRFITHIKRLKGVKEAWQQFLENALNLKEKLGPILFQFPPSFKTTPENIKRLDNFLKFIRENSSSNSHKPSTELCSGAGPVPHRNKVSGAGFARYAFEFRHQSWCDKKIYKILKKYNTAWVIADSPSYPYIETLKKFRSGRLAKSENSPKAEVVTADFVYIRLHGSKILFASKYTKEELKYFAQKIKKWLKTADVYVYFNNDAYGYAIKNAKELLKLPT